MNFDIATLVREALIESGCDNSLLDGFDSHSTIALHFENASMFINVLDDDVWLWTRLIEDSGNSLAQRSAELLEKLMRGCQFSVTGQLQLDVDEGYVQLRGLVQRNYLENGKRFAEALDEFFHLIEVFQEVYR